MSEAISEPEQILVLEVPHEGRTRAWFAASWTEILARRLRNRVWPHIYILDAQDVTELYGDQLPVEMVAILQQHGGIGEIVLGRERRYFPPNEYPGEEKLARAMLSVMNKRARFFTTPDAAARFVNSNRRDETQAEATGAVYSAMQRSGWLQAVEAH